MKPELEYEKDFDFKNNSRIKAKIMKIFKFFEIVSIFAVLLIIFLFIKDMIMVQHRHVQNEGPSVSVLPDGGGLKTIE